MAEVWKLVVCLVLVFIEQGSYQRWAAELRSRFFEQPMDTIKVCLPSAVYVVQNNLLYVSASHLDAATYQVTYQLKILTTAMFTVLILKRSLTKLKWLSLVILLSGVVTVQLAGADSDQSSHNENQSRLLGFTASVTASFLSGFAGICFEKILKGSDCSVWCRNVQLSALSLPMALFTCFTYDLQPIKHHGFFHGYDLFVWWVIFLQAGGGLIVAAVVKFADNILKGFATSLAIVIATLVSNFFFDFHITVAFVMGSAMVMASVFMYSHTPQDKSSDTSKV